MSLEQVGRLEQLLARVQENRTQPRGVRSLQTATQSAHVATPADMPAPALPSPPSNRIERERAVVTEEHVQIPERISMPQARPAVARPAPQAAPVPQSRRHDRSSTPLELAVEGELRRGTPVDLSAPEPITASRRNSITEPTMPATQAGGPVTPSEGFDMPRTFEAEPIREPARPIAQVASKHAPTVEATFGGLLKRSLSLRPH